MLIVTESEIAGLITPEAAFQAVEATFAAMARNEAYNFPVVREALGEGRQYGFKSGLDRTGNLLGLKAGGYFPGNAAKGIINHQSTVILFDPETGVPTAMVGGGLLTALRTAAASAISIDRLARKDAKVLGMVGAGHLRRPGHGYVAMDLHRGSGGKVGRSRLSPWCVPARSGCLATALARRRRRRAGCAR